eukprot:GEMP01023250.1.p1 GENE.GEMP01023250.1~~GEMP01023250.1.p1  ORF type:complete len:236 (+),score=25.72 GEMP01023250.1:341-1048(+)
MPSLADHVAVFSRVDGMYPPDTPFDDTALTYASDFVLAAVMAVIAYRIAVCPDSGLRLPSFVLVTGYATTTLVGGILHVSKQYGLDLNGWTFWAGWIITVGLVASTTGTIGVIGNALHRIPHKQIIPIPKVFDAIWITYGALLTLAVGAGYFRCLRPAADIFLVGICQTLSTVYLLLQLSLNRWPVKRRWVFAIVVVLPRGHQFVPAHHLALFLGSAGDRPPGILSARPREEDIG